MNSHKDDLDNFKREQIEYPENIIVPESEFKKMLMEIHAMLETNQKYLAELISKKRSFSNKEQVLVEMQKENMKNYSDTLNNLPITTK